MYLIGVVCFIIKLWQCRNLVYTPLPYKVPCQSVFQEHNFNIALCYGIYKYTHVYKSALLTLSARMSSKGYSIKFWSVILSVRPSVCLSVCLSVTTFSATTCNKAAKQQYQPTGSVSHWLDFSIPNQPRL